MLNTYFDTPRPSTIRCIYGAIRFFCAHKIYEEIAMGPSARVTKCGRSWDDHLANSLSDLELAW